MRILLKDFDKRKMDYAADLFKMLGDSTRLQILFYLAKAGEATVQEIARGVGKSMSLVSYHLSSIKRCTLILQRRKGKNVYYKIGDERLKSLLELGIKLSELHCRNMITREA